VGESINFGDIVDVEIDVFRGDTNKYSLSIYIEGEKGKISEEYKFHIKDKYSRFVGQIPIKLDDNCDLKKEFGKYYVILDGLGEEDTKKIEVNGIKEGLCGEFDLVEMKTISEKNLCKKTIIEDSYSGKPLNLAEYNIINQLLCVDKVHYKGVVYESKNEKIKKLIPSLVIFTMTLLIFLLLYNGQPKTNEKT